MIDYTHEFVEELRIKAWQYCEAHVFDFQNLSYEETQWYVESVLKMLMEDEVFAKRVFSAMLN